MQEFSFLHGRLLLKFTRIEFLHGRLLLKFTRIEFLFACSKFTRIAFLTRRVCKNRILIPCEGKKILTPCEGKKFLPLRLRRAGQEFLTFTWGKNFFTFTWDKKSILARPPGQEQYILLQKKCWTVHEFLQQIVAHFYPLPNLVDSVLPTIYFIFESLGL